MQRKPTSTEFWDRPARNLLYNLHPPLSDRGSAQSADRTHSATAGAAPSGTSDRQQILAVVSGASGFAAGAPHNRRREEATTHSGEECRLRIRGRREPELADDATASWRRSQSTLSP